jgi:hypothetical protein
MVLVLYIVVTQYISEILFYMFVLSHSVSWRCFSTHTHEVSGRLLTLHCSGKEVRLQLMESEKLMCHDTVDHAKYLRRQELTSDECIVVYSD